MSLVYMILAIGGIILVIALILLITLSVVQRNSVIKRAQKIDPSVKTMAEADYVLKKDIAQSVGNNNQQ